MKHDKAFNKPFDIEAALRTIKDRTGTDVYKRAPDDSSIIFLAPPVHWKPDPGTWRDLTSGKSGKGMNQLITYMEDYHRKRRRAAT